jgi:hypothetical protein
MQTATQTGIQELMSFLERFGDLRYKIVGGYAVLIWRKDSRKAARLMTAPAPMGVLLGYLVHMDQGKLEKVKEKHYGLDMYETTTRTQLFAQTLPIQTPLSSIQRYTKTVVKRLQKALGDQFHVEGSLEEHILEGKYLDIQRKCDLISKRMNLGSTAPTFTVQTNHRGSRR